MANQTQDRDQTTDTARNGQDPARNRNANDVRNEDANSTGRGFAGMDPEKQREIARMGGRAAHESGNAHEFDSAEAREAGRKGGEASARSRAGNDGRNGTTRATDNENRNGNR